MLGKRVGGKETQRGTQMKPIEFPLMNSKVAEDQEEYMTLPAFQDETYTISCWKLTWGERVRLILFGKLWVLALNFGKALQPIAFDTKCPLETKEN
jgi:hypothetical protein